MQHTLTGIHGNMDHNDGKTGAVIIPMFLCKKIEAAIESSDLVDERAVLERFHISKKTLLNYVSSKRIPRCDYTVAFNKSRWFFLNKLLGLKNLFSHKKGLRKTA